MAYDEEYAQIMRKSLSHLNWINEKKMFGGLCFLLNGNMLCGIHKNGGMARVGKENELAALELDGIEPLSFTGRPMGGMVDMSFKAIECKETRDAVLALARQFVEPLPSK